MATKGKRAGKRSGGRVTRTKGRMVALVGGGTRWSRDRKDSGGGMAAERHRRERAGTGSAQTASGGAKVLTKVQQMGDKERQARSTQNAMRKARNRDRVARRRMEAEERQTWWAKLTPEKQLRDLDKRLGRGKGAEKQRKRIAEAMASGRA